MTLYTKPRAELFAQDAPPSEIEPFEDWLRGLGIAFDLTNGYPTMEGFNGLLQALNSYIKYLEQNGFAEWSSDLEYPIGAGVRVGAVWYRAKTQNTNKPPATSQNDWAVFLNASDLTYADPLQVVDGQIKIKDASTTQKGVVRAATSIEVANKTNVTAFISPSNASTIAQSTDIGVGQSWYNVTGSRVSGQIYTNNTGKPIEVIVSIKDSNTYSGVTVTISGTVVINIDDFGADGTVPISFIVPIGASYIVQTNLNTIRHWAELR